MLADEKITAIIEAASSLKEAVQQLIDAANQQGGVDNITVLLIKVGGTAHD